MYPDPNTQKTARDIPRSGPSDSRSNSSGDEMDGPSESSRLPPIPDEDAEPGLASEPSSAVSAPVGGMLLPAHDSMSPTNKERGSRSPPGEGPSKPPSRRPQPHRVGSRQQLRTAQLSGPKWASLTKDIRFFLKYHRDNITCNHYALKYDGSNFLQTTFLEIALGYEPLLYAITAFSAYFYTIKHPNGRVQMFLQYYNKSVSLLRESLAKAQKHSSATLLCILQLATFEVCPGLTIIMSQLLMLVRNTLEIS